MIRTTEVGIAQRASGCCRSNSPVFGVLTVDCRQADGRRPALCCMGFGGPVLVPLVCSFLGLFGRLIGAP